jgi:UDP-N-acetylmuramyl pentapeptide phosphotransferase/UDP-N-acetylglucosamine-1-phosphate transferase
MEYCPKCGAKIDEDAAFCPKCGVALKAGQVSAETRPYIRRRHEKDEKDEKDEKGEKHEKRGYSFLGPLIGGLILIVIGLTSYLEITGYADRRSVWAVFFVIIGVIIIVGAIYGSIIAGRRNPKP